MKKLLLSIIVLALTSTTYAGDLDRMICEEMVRAQNGGKSFDNFKLDYEDGIASFEERVIPFARADGDGSFC